MQSITTVNFRYGVWQVKVSVGDNAIVFRRPLPSPPVAMMPFVRNPLYIKPLQLNR